MKNDAIAPQASDAWRAALRAFDRELQRRGAAERTRRAYGVDLAQLALWCSASSVEPDAVDYPVLRRYAAQLAGRGAGPRTVARKLAEAYPVELVNSVNPARIEGQKTAAFEVVDALGDAPDIHVLPVGNAGNITAYWRGYTEYAEPTPGTGGWCRTRSRAACWSPRPPTSLPPSPTAG